ncbi:hypothetical protein FPZ42_10995 [Mucilaginibacter achroorhodeus]|uniref:Uncharacterized protein n=1 Tax=Mucilaginibacter achroorhodeus TaxID=2599294 RepID=A0A563U471_9SPHI|nr:hypothetical protein [Mucilaginibacter achroorhodeus]TWR26147.1 hypothetical protein FPZ42_10995 [Mucilaginibacter achroorhodeus]
MGNTYQSMKETRYIIRRTLSQERFEVLWTKHKNGQTTLKDLAEMDEIINRDAGVRRFVLEEMATQDFPGRDENLNPRNTTQPSGFLNKLLAKIKSVFKRLFGQEQQTSFVNFPSSY